MKQNIPIGILKIRQLMEIKSIDAFLTYYERTREVTNRVIQAIPHDQLEFTYMPGKFTIGDMVRHIAAVERNLFARVAKGNRSTYSGCGKELADGYDNILSYFNEMHQESLVLFKTINDEDLTKTVTALNGKEMQLARFLSALIVHEVHHRGALCIYLNLLGVNTPPILGFTEEQVIQVSR